MAEIAKFANSQDAVFALLGDPATYGGAKVRRYDTHGAVVFLAGDRAIKVKRAVRYPFLDYLDVGQAQSRLPRRARSQSQIRAAALSPHRADHAGRRRPVASPAPAFRSSGLWR